MDPAKPLLNLVHYSPLEHALFGAGCLLWVAAYLVLIVRIHRLKFVEMPIFAACFNMAWEAVWSLWLATDMGRFFEGCYFAWFFLDLFIFGHIIWYGHRQVRTPTLARHFKPIAVAGTLLLGLLIYAFVREGLDSPMGARSGYIVQLPISLLYFLLLYDDERRPLLSVPIAWLRSVGTGLVGVFMFLHYRSDFFLMVMVGASSLLDVLFLAQLHALPRQVSGGRSPFRPICSP